MNISSKFNYPKTNLFSGFINWLLNFNTPLQTALSKLKLRSDIENVVYVNWMVPFKKVQHLLPTGINVETYEGNVLLTVLNYNHGNFRPNFLNPLKFIFGSPNQSNWRLYLNPKNLDEDISGVLFLTNIISQFSYTFGSRIFSQILKAHWPLSFVHLKKENRYTTKITSGLSHSPDLDFQLYEKDEWKIPESFKWISNDVKTLLKIVCNQDMAISKINEKKLSRAKIHLDFDLDTIKPLTLSSLESNTLKDLIKDSECFAFVIPKVTFCSLGEKMITV